MAEVEWDFSAMEQFNSDRGDQVIWEKGAPCPSCTELDPLSNMVDKNGSSPPTKVSLNCQTCSGDGYIYRDPQVITGLITSVRSADRQLLEMGFALPGDCIFSPPPSINPAPGDFDRITFVNPSNLSEGQVIVRGAAYQGDNAALKHRLGQNEDRLWYLGDCGILCEDTKGVTYSWGTDYVFDDKKIRWIGNAPPVGRPYVVKYRGYLEWVVFNADLDRFDRGRHLGPRVMIRQKHVYFFNGAPGDSPGERQQEAVKFRNLTSI